MEGNPIIRPYIVHAIEHEEIVGNDRAILDESGVIFKQTEYESKPEYLGIFDHTTSYYIGATWLVKSQSAVVVTPKIDNVNFMEMFLYAFKHAPTDGYFEKFYDLDFSNPPIRTESVANILSPLLIAHFLQTLNRLVKRDLKKGYLIREENLKSKIKGRIVVGKDLKYNVFTNQRDKTYCRYQEFTPDIIENRILKKALLFSERLLLLTNVSGNSDSLNQMLSITRRFLGYFINVSSEVDIHHIQQIKPNKLFKDYDAALKIAKLILRHFDYSINNVKTDIQETPPFWIDMSRLYEVYVYGKLKEAYGSQNIAFQVKGHCRSQVDYLKLDDHLIMDAKYKPRYEDSNKGILADIREISGYARDSKILKRLGINENSQEELKCLIIYPTIQNFESEGDGEDDYIDINNDVIISSFGNDILANATSIPWFRNFYKVCVPLPTYIKNV